MVLVVEDDAARTKWFQQMYGSKAEVVAVPSNAIVLLKALIFDTLFLDHDLGTVNGKELTVEPLVDFLCTNDINIHNGIIVHSVNFPAASQIVRQLRAVSYKVSYVPFTILRDYSLERIASL